MPSSLEYAPADTQEPLTPADEASERLAVTQFMFIFRPCEDGRRYYVMLADHP